MHPPPNRNLRRRSSAVTSDRVSLVPGFLGRGVHSGCIAKQTDNLTNYVTECVEEHLDSLVRHKGDPRRSERLKKTSSVSDGSNPSTYPTTTTSAQSKSVFKDIQHRYLNRIRPPTNQDISTRLFGQLSRHFQPEKYGIRDAIRHEISTLNALLLETSSTQYDMSLPRKRTYETTSLDESHKNKENIPLKYACVPQSKWVFQTPPNRKLDFRHVKPITNENTIQPGVLDPNQRILYEVNSKVRVDLTQFVNQQEVNIDKRYMVEVGREEQEQKVFHFKRPNDEEGMSTLQPDPFELEHHFLGLTCRPKKTLMASSRIPNLKRKRDLFELENAEGLLHSGHEEEEVGILETPEAPEMASNMEESYSFRFTANSGGMTTTTRIFDFAGNEKDTFNMSF